MDDATETAVLRAIGTMQDRLGDQLSVDDLARSAMFSKFHFTRMFQRVTGVSPGRFLSALRLQRAKELLVSTSMKVADISVSVGYNSVGTFSSRFSRSVGMSPTIYRRRSGYATAIDTDSVGIGHSGAAVTCHVHLAEPDPDALIFVGLFADRIPEGRPARCAVVRQSSGIVFDTPPLGSWYLLAQSVSAADDTAGATCDRADRPVAVATAGPLVIRPDTIASTDLVLRPCRALDPPVLLALLDVRIYALDRMAAARGPAEAAYARAA
jgi:AraC family transcriptional regulator